MEGSRALGVRALSGPALSCYSVGRSEPLSSGAHVIWRAFIHPYGEFGDLLASRGIDERYQI
jgi:hypothetical protein